MVLRAEGVRVVAGGVEILASVDIEVPRGRVVTILGPNGAGKSTLFRVLAGELAPVAGRVWLGDAEVTRLALWQRARRGLGYVPQTPSVLFDLTVAENFRAFERAARAPRLAAEERAAAVSLGSRLTTRARDLSGGERRRLELARALVADPQVLVCDEPFAGGDPASVRQVGALLRALADAGRAVLVADHRASDALSIADEAILLAEGKVQLQAVPSEFSDHPAVVGRYLGQ